MRHITVCAVFLSACGSLPRPECLDNSTCDLQPGGVCTVASTGHKWCGYPVVVTACSSGYVWSPEAGDGLARSCVTLIDAGITDASIDASTETSDGPIETPDARMADASPEDAPEALPADAGASDSPVPDASPPDSSEPDADPSGPLTLTVLDNTQLPLAGARVISHVVDGRWLDTAITDAQGHATMRVPPGGAITVATIEGSEHLLTTVFGVKPGDTLVVMDAEGDFPVRGGQVGEAHISMPGSRAGASSYAMGATCAFNRSVTNASSTITQPLYELCSAADPVAAVATAISATPANIAFSAGAGPLSGGVATINLPQWVAATDIDVDLLHSSSSLDTIEKQAALVNAGRAGVSLYCTVPDTGTLRCPVPVTPSGSLALRAFVTLYAPSGTYDSRRSLLTDIPLPANDPKIDFADLPPLLGGLTVDLFSANRPRLRWSSSEPIESLDAGFVLLSWKDASDGNHDWMFVVPPSQSAVAPDLPAGFVGDWIPAVPASGIHMDLMWFGQGPAETTYDDVRQNYPAYLRLGVEGKFVRVTTLD